MSTHNPFHPWKLCLPLYQLRDVRAWFGVWDSESCESYDADIGIYLNGIAMDYLFGNLAKRPQTLQKGFVPQRSRISAAISPEQRAAFVHKVIKHHVTDLSFSGLATAAMTAANPQPQLTKDQLLSSLHTAHQQVTKARECQTCLKIWQVMQLCLHFKLYSYQDIQKFLTEHQR